MKEKCRSAIFRDNIWPDKKSSIETSHWSEESLPLLQYAVYAIAEGAVLLDTNNSLLLIKNILMNVNSVDTQRKT